MIQWAKSHYKLGIVSNGIGEAQRRRLKSAGMYEAFDSLIFSDEAGVYKPDPRIFQMAIKQLGARPEQVLYIGDSLHDDYQGAKNAGIDFCWYNPKGLDAGDASPLHIIHRLSELKAWLRHKNGSAKINRQRVAMKAIPFDGPGGCASLKLENGASGF